MHTAAPANKRRWEEKKEAKDVSVSKRAKVKDGLASKMKKVDPSAEFAIGDVKTMVGPTTRKKKARK